MKRAGDAREDSAPSQPSLMTPGWQGGSSQTETCPGLSQARCWVVMGLTPGTLCSGAAHLCRLLSSHRCSTHLAYLPRTWHVTLAPVSWLLNLQVLSTWRTQFQAHCPLLPPHMLPCRWHSLPSFLPHAPAVFPSPSAHHKAMRSRLEQGQCRPQVSVVTEPLLFRAGRVLPSRPENVPQSDVTRDGAVAAWAAFATIALSLHIVTLGLQSNALIST